MNIVNVLLTDLPSDAWERVKDANNNGSLPYAVGVFFEEAFKACLADPSYGAHEAEHAVARMVDDGCPHVEKAERDQKEYRRLNEIHNDMMDLSEELANPPLMWGIPVKTLRRIRTAARIASRAMAPTWDDAQRRGLLAEDKT
jgi:hypothetical protein